MHRVDRVAYQVAQHLPYFAFKTPNRLIRPYLLLHPNAGIHNSALKYRCDALDQLFSRNLLRAARLLVKAKRLIGND
jgi:hypothetical protein